MAAGYLAGPQDANNTPIAEVYPPGSTGLLVALQGSTNTTTDAKGNVSAPANFNLAQIGNIATQMGASGGTMVLGNSPTYVIGLWNGGSNLNPWAAVAGDNSGAGQVAAVGIGLLNPNGNLDRQRGNMDNVVAIASAAYTTTQTSADMTNYNHRGMIAVLNVSAGTTPALTLEVDGKDPVSGTYYSLLTASAAVAATGTFVYMVYPGASTTVTNTGVTQSSGMVLPRTWRVKVTAGNANSITYSVGTSFIV